MRLIRELRVVWKLLIFGILPYTEFSTELTKLVKYDACMSQLIKLVTFLSNFFFTSTTSVKHTCTHSAKNTMLTREVPLWIGIANGLLTDISHNCTCQQFKDECVYQLNTLNMPQCRDPVVHKLCIRTLIGYLFICLLYSRLSLFRPPRGSLKYTEIPVLRHIRFPELREN